MGFNWVRPCLVVNGFVMAVARINLGHTLVAEWLACAVRDALIVVFLTVATSDKPRIRGKTAASWQSWARLVGVAAPVDALVGVLATSCGWRSWDVPRVSFLHFVLFSFLFEIVFDFFHYWTHRWAHTWNWSWHKQHHRSHRHGLSPIATYDQSVLDVLVSNAVPACAALAWLSGIGLRFSNTDFRLLWTYKSYVEVAGHCGVHSRATSFPQCVWLPRLFGIELRTVDHDLHHSARGRGCNFGKRFTLWDRLFSTYAATT